MSLTPKNWKSFQHYKDRAPIWIKLHRSLLDDFEFHCLPVASKALAPLLWLLASEYQDGAITLATKAIAFRLRMSVAEFEAALKPLIDGEFFISSAALADRKPVATPEKERETEREEESETDTRAKDRPASAQIDLEEAIEAVRGREPSRFEEFWTAYPRREGPNPRKPAESKFNALVKTGLDPQMLIDAVKKLATDEAGRGNIGTRFVPQAATWLNQQRWSDHAAVAALAEAAGTTVSELQLESAVKFYARTRVWSRHAGPEPGLTGCKASAELLAKYDLLPDGRRIQPGEAA